MSHYLSHCSKTKPFVALYVIRQLSEYSYISPLFELRVRAAENAAIIPGYMLPVVQKAHVEPAFYVAAQFKP